MPGIRHPLAHWMQHADPLAQEFDDILGLTDIFGEARAEWLKGLVFFAPLGGDAVDRVSGLPGAFTRASADAVYLDAVGEYQLAAANEPRAEFSADGTLLGTLFEPAVTNKCSNYNDASALTGITTSGDPATVLSIVADDDVEAAGLSSLIAAGSNVFDWDNSAGAIASNANVNGATGNTNVHTVSVWAKLIAGAPILQLSGVVGSVTVTSPTWTRVSGTGTPGGTGNLLQVRVPAGSHVRFVLNQLEESPVVTSPIITRGATSSRAADALNWPGTAMLEDAAGSIVLDFIPVLPVPDPPIITGVLHLLSVHSLQGTLYWSAHAAANRLSWHDSTTQLYPLLGAIEADAVYRCATRWTGAARSIGFSKSGAAFTWADGAYDGTIARNAGQLDIVNFGVGSSLLTPVRLRNVRIWDRDLGKAEIERLFT